MIIIGYSGHGFVVCGIIKAAGKSIAGYCDSEEKTYNPFALNILAKKMLMQPLQHLNSMVSLFQSVTIPFGKKSIIN